MRLPLSWLKSYLNLPESPEQIAHALTLAGIEVEGMHHEGQDLILEISLTPNLGHCLSIVGLARELGAIFNREIKRHLVQFKETKEDPTHSAISIEIQEPKGCPHYSCRLVRGVKVGPSPDWLRERIEACGLRSLNNVVDVANYVLLESGHPLHFFDYQALPSKKILVRQTEKEELFQSLDEVERFIPPGILMIYSGDKPVAIAGVMGDLHSAVSSKTQDILIESAAFSPTSIRKSSKLLGIRTESSMRYERGINPVETLDALERAVELLIQVAGGKACYGAVDQVAEPFKSKVVTCRPSRVNRLLGTTLSHNEMVSLLRRLEMEVIVEEEDLLKVNIPPYRNDVSAEIDLVEEIGRLYGFNNIARRAPKHASSLIPHAPLFEFEEEIRNQLIALRLQECLTCDLISPKLAALTAEKAQGEEAQITVLHPSSVDQSVLRTCLLPGLLQVVKFNIDHQNENLSLFEVGHIHFKQDEHYHEQSAAAIILSGKRAPYHFESKEQEADFFDLKGRIEDLLHALGLREEEFEPSHMHNFHPNRQARVKIGSHCLGIIGEVHPQHLKELGIDQRVYFAELNLHDLYPLVHAHRQSFSAKIPPAFPSSTRDWTISLSDELPIRRIFELAYSLSSPLLSHLALIDLYKSDKIGKDRKNATFRFTYRDISKTVEFNEVEQEHLRLIERIQEQLRGLI